MLRNTEGTPDYYYRFDVRGFSVSMSPSDREFTDRAAIGVRKRIMYFTHNSVNADEPGSPRI